MRAFLWLIIFNFICVPAPQVKPVQTGSSQPQPVQQSTPIQPATLIQPATAIQPATPIQYTPIKSIPLSPIVSQPVQRLYASTPQQPIQRSQSVQTLYASSPQQQSGVNGRLRSQFVATQTQISQP
eukprot:276466_1